MSVWCQRSFVESRVEPDFFACKCTHANFLACKCTCTNIEKHHQHKHEHKKTQPLITPHLRSGICSLPICVRGLSLPSGKWHLTCRPYETWTIWTVCQPYPSSPNKLPSRIRQETALATEAWVIEPMDNLDESGHRHKHAFYLLLNEWFHGRDYTCTLLTKQ